MVSIVIPVLNGAHTISAQLDALLTQVSEIGEVVVVDNGSTDGTSSVVTSFLEQGLPVRVVSEPKRGVNRARNAGIRASQFEKVLLCDADDIVDSDWVRSLSTLLDTFDTAGTSVTRVYINQGDTVHLMDPSTLGPIIAGLYSPWGGSAAFRKAAWTSVGGFDERMSGGADDLDFFLRTQLAGFTVGWDRSSKLTYLDNSDATKALRRQREMDVNLGRVASIAWLNGKEGRHSVLPDLIKLPLAALLAVLGPSASRRARVNRLTRRLIDRSTSIVQFGIPELRRAGFIPVARRITGLDVHTSR